VRPNPGDHQEFSHREPGPGLPPGDVVTIESGQEFGRRRHSTGIVGRVKCTTRFITDPPAEAPESGRYHQCRVRFDSGVCFLRIDEGDQGQGRIDVYPLGRVASVIGLFLDPNSNPEIF
jgi:hypothetical protein